MDDFKQVDGVWVIDINAIGDKKVKTKAGQRLVPLHPFLTNDLKILKHVDNLRKQKQGRFFPELAFRRDGYGQTASKWFQRYRDRCGIVGRGKVFHSFRHTFIDTLKQAQVNDVALSEVVGHEVESMTLGRYGKRYQPKVVFDEVISRLNYEVDLSHLKKSRFAR